MKKGEEVEKTVNAPEDFADERLKGQPIVYNVSVSEIKEENLSKVVIDTGTGVGGPGGPMSAPGMSLGPPGMAPMQPPPGTPAMRPVPQGKP